MQIHTKVVLNQEETEKAITDFLQAAGLVKDGQVLEVTFLVKDEGTHAEVVIIGDTNNGPVEQAEEAPKRRTRRTAAQIHADNQAEAAEAVTKAGPAVSLVATPETDAKLAEQGITFGQAPAAQVEEPPFQPNPAAPSNVPEGVPAFLTKDSPKIFTDPANSAAAVPAPASPPPLAGKSLFANLTKPVTHSAPAE
jgi:hypothetical protein